MAALFIVLPIMWFTELSTLPITPILVNSQSSLEVRWNFSRKANYYYYYFFFFFLGGGEYRQRIWNTNRSDGAFSMLWHEPSANDYNRLASDWLKGAASPTIRSALKTPAAMLSFTESEIWVTFLCCNRINYFTTPFIQLIYYPVFCYASFTFLPHDNFYFQQQLVEQKVFVESSDKLKYTLNCTTQLFRKQQQQHRQQ